MVVVGDSAKETGVVTIRGVRPDGVEREDTVVGVASRHRWCRRVRSHARIMRLTRNLAKSKLFCRFKFDPRLPLYSQTTVIIGGSVIECPFETGGRTLLRGPANSGIYTQGTQNAIKDRGHEAGSLNNVLPHVSDQHPSNKVMGENDTDSYSDLVGEVVT